MQAHVQNVLAVLAVALGLTLVACERSAPGSPPQPSGTGGTAVVTGAAGALGQAGNGGAGPGARGASGGTGGHAVGGSPGAGGAPGAAGQTGNVDGMGGATRDAGVDVREPILDARGGTDVNQAALPGVTLHIAGDSTVMTWVST